MGISINHSGASYNLVSGSNFSEITAPFAKDQKKKNSTQFSIYKTAPHLIWKKYNRWQPNFHSLRIFTDLSIYLYIWVKYADWNLSKQACHIPMVKSPNYQNKTIAITQKNNTTTCINLLVLRVEISPSSFSILSSAKKTKD